MLILDWIWIGLWTECDYTADSGSRSYPNMYSQNKCLSKAIIYTPGCIPVTTELWLLPKRDCLLLYRCTIWNVNSGRLRLSSRNGLMGNEFTLFSAQTTQMKTRLSGRLECLPNDAVMLWYICWPWKPLASFTLVRPQSPSGVTLAALPPICANTAAFCLSVIA